MTPKNLITVKAAADILCVCTQTIRKWDRQGKIQSKRMKNGYRFFSVSELEKFAHSEKLRKNKREIVD